MQEEIIIFTDGACKANGKDGAKAGFGVHVVGHPTLQVQARLPASEKQTNQRAELYAILHAFLTTQAIEAPIKIYSDSQYCVKIFNEWLPNWLQKNIVKENWDIIMPIYQASRNRNYKIIHVSAHRKITPDMDDQMKFLISGNAKADELATGTLQQ